MTVDPFELCLAFDQRLAGQGNNQKAIGEAIDPVKIGGQIDLTHQGVGIEARVLGAVDQKAEKCLQVQRVVGPGGHIDRVFVMPGAITRGVAGGAVIGYPLEPDPAFSESHW